VSVQLLPILAHPTSDPLRLPIETWSLAAVSVMLVIAAAALTPRGNKAPEPRATYEPRTPFDWTLRVVGAGVLLGSIVVARIGSPFELENPSSVLLAAFLWPAFALFCFVWASLWDRVDPFDTLARIFEPNEPTDRESPHDVRLAAVFALAWTWYLSVYTQPLKPESFGLFLGAYLILMLAGSLAIGRRSWLRRAEAFGAFYRTVGASRRVAREAALPRGGNLFFGVTIGGVLFGVLRLTTAWGDLNISPQATLWSTIGLIVCCGVVVTALELVERFGSNARAVLLAAAPFAAGVVLAVGLLRNRLFVTAQILPSLLLDPMDSGLDPLGWSDPLIDPNPLGTTGLVMAQIAILTVGAIAGAVIARRRVGSEANPVIGVVCALLVASVFLVAGVAFPG
jgi:hypothetical protein